ncbi:MAG TPA: hypothetical protein DIC64_01290, partial [Alphaproteobacteria bacterium]|nr:hypothetical protein [Alphaproteobacteria bacterium]
MRVRFPLPAPIKRPLYAVFLLELKWEANPKRAQSGEKVLNVPLRPLWCRFVNEQKAAATFANVTNQTARAVGNSAFPLPAPIKRPFFAVFFIGTKVG